MGRPALYQIQARDWLWRLKSGSGILTLDRLPDRELDRLQALGFDWLYLLGVWQTGPAGAAISKSEKPWRASFEAALPDLTETDIVGSTFAITGYTVHRDFGGNAALAKLRARLKNRGIRLLLDFVPNHVAPDHPWVAEHPDYFVTGDENALAAAPQNFMRLPGGRILAHGRDPYFAGWPDTVQLNYGNQALQETMIQELRSIAALCDGVRCDMAMLLLPEVFQKTWGIAAPGFWPRAIPAARAINQDFLFIAEVYWSLGGMLQQQGFDYTYDKTLYDRLLERKARAVRSLLGGDVPFQQKCVRFLENHDEARIAAALPKTVHKAAALITYFAPGMSFFHDGQLEGFQRRPSIHLARRAIELGDSDLKDFYQRLLRALEAGPQGKWVLLEASPAWESNPTDQDFLCFAWLPEQTISYLIVVNYSGHDSQCYVRFPAGALERRELNLKDVLGTVEYRRAGGEMLDNGLYVALPAWGFNLFQVSEA